jgi:hypothetical protein
MTADEKIRRFERALALGGNTHSVQDVVAKVREGRAQYWEHGETCAITEVIVFPRFSTCNLWLTAGTLAECYPLNDSIAGWAADQGCKWMTASGRIGWQRVAASFGWRPRAMQFYKELTP